MADYTDVRPDERWEGEINGSSRGGREWTYEIISKVAFLIGVPRQVFENGHQPPRFDVYERLTGEQAPRTIRSLCKIRSNLIRNFDKVHKAMTYEMKNLHTLPELFSADDIKQLEKDGIQLLKANYRINLYLIDINKYIADNIGRCQSLFPIWLNWDYIKDLFIMPSGRSEEAIKAEGLKYVYSINSYPYQMFISWTPTEEGNILYNDEKFVEILYAAHNDAFYDTSKVRDAAKETKNSIYAFLRDNEKIAIVVDCENSDPYKLYSVLKNLDPDELCKIKKIILYNDVHTASAWKILNQFVSVIPIEHEMIERLTDRKSLVDMKLAMGTSREFYKNGIGAFVIASSDSDYWAMISELPEAAFLVMVEHSKVGYDLQNALEDAGIYYCFMDDFTTGNIGEIMTGALITEIRASLDESIKVNINEVLERAYTNTRVVMSSGERKQFYDNYIKKMRLQIDKDGTLRILLAEQ